MVVPASFWLGSVLDRQSGQEDGANLSLGDVVFERALVLAEDERRRMRITVYDVLSYLAAGMTVAEILNDFPYLTAEDIQACLAYAAERERTMVVT